MFSPSRRRWYHQQSQCLLFTHDSLFVFSAGGSALIEAQNDQSSLDGATLQEHLVNGETVTIVTSSGDTVVQASTLATLQQHPPPQPPQAGHPPPPASHSLQHLNKLASEQQQTLAGTLGHTPPTLPPQYPPSPVVIQPTGAGDTTPTNASGGNSNSVLNMNGPLTPQSMPSNGSGGGGGGVGVGGAQSGQVTTAAQNGQDVQNNNTVKVKSCAGCGARICDRFLLHAMERYWHTGCLKCSCCQAQLGEIGTTCYAKAGMILCKNDYIRWAKT